LPAIPGILSKIIIERDRLVKSFFLQGFMYVYYQQVNLLLILIMQRPITLTATVLKIKNCTVASYLLLLVDEQGTVN